MNLLQTGIEKWIGYQVAWDDTASWVQAVFSVVAIAASAFFAIWTPLHMNRQAELNSVQRAINSLVIYIGQFGATWEATQHTVESGTWSPGTGSLLLSQVQSAKRLEALIPPSMFMATAFTVVSKLGMMTNILEQIIEDLNDAADPVERGADLPFENGLEDLERIKELGAHFAPRRVSGYWMIYHPDDAAEIAAAARSRAPA